MANIKSVDVKTLKGWLDSKDAVLVDVREPAEYQAQNIPQAFLLPLGQVSVKTIPEIKGKKLVIHCKSGGRGGKACEKLLAENPDIEVYNLEGGITAWSAYGENVKSSGKFFLSLDRQVQLIVGALVLISSILAYTVNPAWIFLAGLFGAGLTFAGLTGFCGLAMLLAKMPWNQCVKEKSFCMTK